MIATGDNMRLGSDLMNLKRNLDYKNASNH